jgi:hypothetical protein
MRFHRFFLWSALVRLFWYNDSRALPTKPRFLIELSIVCFVVAIGTSYIVTKLLMLLLPK